MPAWLIVIALLMLFVVVVKATWLIVMAARFHARRAWEPQGDGPTFVSVLVPAFNEELTLGNTLLSLDAQTWTQMEVIVVDDGSTDRTRFAAEELASAMRVPTRVLSKPNGGKADALNAGMRESRGEILVCVDADSSLAPDAVERLREPFADPTVGAVGGVVAIANRNSVLGLQQAVEYVTGQMLQRAAFGQVGSIQVLSGAISAFRREAIESVGGFPADTIVEDFDVTVAVQREGYRATLHPGALAHTEGPLTILDLARQRHRWTFGGFQVLAKYRSDLFTRRMGRLSRVGLPYFLLFPWFDVAVSLLLFATLGLAFRSGTFAAFAAYLAVMSAANLVMSLHALRLAHEPWTLALWSVAQVFFYAHLLSFVTARAGLRYLSRGRSYPKGRHRRPGRQADWVKLERSGQAVPAASRTPRRARRAA